MQIENHFFHSKTFCRQESPSPTNSKTQAIANDILTSLPTIGLLDPFSVAIGVGIGVIITINWFIDSEQDAKQGDKTLCDIVKDVWG